MRVLLLDSKDDLPPSALPTAYDLIVDFGRAPASTYAEWSRKAGARVMSLYDFAEEISDLRRVKALLDLGMGPLLDESGVDWWDVTSILIFEGMLRLILVSRLVKELPTGCGLYSTRPGPIATAIERLSKGRLHNLESGVRALARRVRHYPEALSNLESNQIAQILQDKFDPEHAIRRLWQARPRGLTGPFTLFPSGYINVSRMAVAYASMLPQERFLLVCARSIGKLQVLPENVKQTSLDPFFSPGNSEATASLLSAWEALKFRLISSAGEFAVADEIGVLSRIAPLIRSGIAVRDAWENVFETQNIAACFCCDDTVPYTRIPLILAKHRKIPAVASHHGALDSRMGIKMPHADIYLAKGKMESDYLERVCRLPATKIMIGAPAAYAPLRKPLPNLADKPWLVFFTEPFEAYGWRRDKVYADLLPKLIALAKSRGLKLILKLHPFESQKSIRRLLRAHLSKREAREIAVIAGPISAALWGNTSFAVTVQSTVALECCMRGVPVFLFAWLREPFGGYLTQYARFGVGKRLESSEQIKDIPDLLEIQDLSASLNDACFQPIDPHALHDLLHGDFARSGKDDISS